MTGTAITPYPTLAGDVTLTVRQAQLDGTPVHLSLISGKDQVIALHHVEKRSWEQARLTVRVQTPLDEIARQGDTWSRIACHVVLSEKRTNTRLMTPLTRGEAGDWSGVVELHRDRHVAQAKLEAVVSATVGDFPGRIIGSSIEPWTVDFIARAPSRQHSVKTVWVDFAADSNQHLQAYKANPWTIDTTSVEPTLYLNEGFEGLKPLLNSTKGDRTSRETVLAQIAMDVWMALFNAAVYALDPEEADASWPDDWRQDVLRRLLPDMFPEKSPRTALAEVRERRLEGDGDLQTRLVHAAARQARIPRILTTFLRAREQQGVGTGEAS
jgi:hypothetical protein